MHSHGALAKIRFGEKTFAALYEILQHYPLEVVKKYIKLGAANNGIWETKQDESFDTDEYVEEVNNTLSERGN